MKLAEYMMAQYEPTHTMYERLLELSRNHPDSEERLAAREAVASVGRYLRFEDVRSKRLTGTAPCRCPGCGERHVVWPPSATSSEDERIKFWGIAQAPTVEGYYYLVTCSQCTLRDAWIKMQGPGFRERRKIR